MKIDTLQALFVEELKDLYSAETQITKALPKMAKSAQSAELKAAFQKHLGETEEQLKRLESIFEGLGKSPRGKKCKAMEGLLEEGSELMKEDIDPDVLDAGLIAAAQRVEHYEIAAYGTAVAYAKLLRDTKSAQLLQATLEEEGATDKALTKLAMSGINVEAM